ncbi:unnamed protein product [Arabidopsis halleri]
MAYVVFVGMPSLLLVAPFDPVFCVLAFVSFSLLPDVVVALDSVRFDLLPFILFGVVRIDLVLLVSTLKI